MSWVQMGKRRSIPLNQKLCFFQGCLPNQAQPEARSRKDRRRKPAKLPRHWWFWQFRNKELETRQDCFNHHSHSLPNSGRNFVLGVSSGHVLWIDISQYPSTNCKTSNQRPKYTGCTIPPVERVNYGEDHQPFLQLQRTLCVVIAKSR